MSKDYLRWGATAIGARIGKGQKDTLRMLEQGRIKCAVKRGGRWTAADHALCDEFGLSDRRQDDAADATVELRNGGA
jgi:hypothetical protein